MFCNSLEHFKMFYDSINCNYGIVYVYFLNKIQDYQMQGAKCG